MTCTKCQSLTAMLTDIMYRRNRRKMVAMKIRSADSGSLLWTTAIEEYPEVRTCILVEWNFDMDGSYRDKMITFGARLNQFVREQQLLETCLPHDFPARVVCAAQDADYLASTFISCNPNVSLTCLWLDAVDITTDGNGNRPPVYHISKGYNENKGQQNGLCIVVAPVVSGDNYVKTVIMRAVSAFNPDRIVIASIAMTGDAEDRISSAFPKSISDRFQFLRFLTVVGDKEDAVLQKLSGDPARHETRTLMPMLVKRRRETARRIRLFKETHELPKV